MSRPKTPTAILQLNGAFKKNPDRKREGEPKAEAIGPPPKYFKVKQKNIWKEVVSKCAEGVLQASDEMALEVMCLLIEEFRYSPISFQSAKMAQLQQLMKGFGMTPSSRASISVPKKETKKSTYKDM